MKEQLQAIIELCDAGVFSSFPVFLNSTSRELETAMQQHAADRNQDFIAIRAIAKGLLDGS